MRKIVNHTSFVGSPAPYVVYVAVLLQQKVISVLAEGQLEIHQILIHNFHAQ